MLSDGQTRRKLKQSDLEKLVTNAHFKSSLLTKNVHCTKN